MNEHEAPIYEYVRAADVAASLGGAGISAAECESARLTIEHERAQWVVDSIALELDSRRQVLADRKAKLTDELGQVDADLAIIDSVREPQKDPNIVTELIELYDAKVYYNTFEDIAKDQAPFTLKLQYEQHRSDMLNRPAFSVHEWASSNRGDLEHVYGKRIAATIMRSAHVIDCDFTWNDHSDYPEMQRAVIRDESSTDPELVVNNPSKFFGYMFDGRNRFSHKSLVATLCLVEFQNSQS